MSAGRNFPYLNGTISVEAGRHESTYGNKPLYSGLVLAINGYRQMSDTTGIKVGFTTHEFLYKDFSHLNALQLGLTLQGFYSPTSTQRLEVSIGSIGNMASEKAYAFAQNQFGGRATQEWQGGWSTSINADLTSYSYEAADPIFLKSRVDLDRRLEVELSNRLVNILGLTPRLQFGSVERVSNIDFYRYDRTYLRLGLTAVF
jgi:hypothetical protein